MVSCVQHDYRYTPEGSTSTLDMVVCSKCGNIIRTFKVRDITPKFGPSTPAVFPNGDDLRFPNASRMDV